MFGDYPHNADTLCGDKRKIFQSVYERLSKPKQRKGCMIDVPVSLKKCLDQAPNNVSELGICHGPGRCSNLPRQLGLGPYIIEMALMGSVVSTAYRSP